MGSNPTLSAIYVGSSLEVKASACEAEEGGAIPLCHPKIITSGLKVGHLALNEKVVGSIPTS